MKRTLRLCLSFWLCALLACGGFWALAEDGVPELSIDADEIEIEGATNPKGTTSDGGDNLLEDKLDIDNQDTLVLPDEEFTDIALPDIELLDIDSQDMEILADPANASEVSDIQISNAVVGDTVQLDGIRYEITASGAVAKGVADGAIGITEIAFPAFVSGYALTRIDSRAFYQCDGLMKVTIPGNVKVIGDSAFQDCDSLNSVVLEAGVEEIGSSAFRGCNILTSLTMDTGLKTVNSSAFVESPIEELLFPDTVTSLSSSALNGGSSNDSLHANLKRVRWPAGVSRIPDSQFSSFSALETVVIPDTLTNFGTSAFRDCPNLSVVNFPDAVTGIGSSAFYGCTSLKSANIPGRIMSISSSAFYKSGLEAVTIPANVKSIGDYAFYDCDELASVVLVEGVEEIGSQAFANCDKLKSLSMGNGLKAIKDSAFVNSAIESLSFPDTIKTLSPSALNGSSNCLLHRSLKKVVWPASLSTIPKSQFASFTALEEIVIPDAVTEIDQYAFDGCSSLVTVALPPNVTIINPYTFQRSGLQTMTIPGTVKTIGSNAFYDCNKLTNVTLEEGVEEIGQYAFQSCDTLTSLTMKKGLKTVGNGAFIYSPIAELSFPDTVTSLTFSAIQSNDYSSDILKNSLKKVRWTAGIKTVPDKQFSNFPVLETVTIPEGVESIGNNAFYGCSALTAISIPSSLTGIGNYAFYRTGFTTLTIPGNVKVLGEYAFYDCNKLTSATLEAGVEEIGQYAFQSCDTLTSLTMKKGLKTVGNGAFIYSPIAELSFPDTVTSLTFSAIQSNDYSSDILKNSLKKVRWTAGIKTVPDKQFSNFPVLKTVTIPEGVESIGNNAFYGCSTLTAISIPSSLTGIGNYAFYRTGFTTLTIPGNVKVLGEYAFYDCNKLTSATLEAGVEEIGQYAFQSCDTLTSLTMKKGLKTVANGAFTYSPIAELSFPDTVTSLAFSAIQSDYSSDILKNSLKKVRWTAGIKTVPDKQFSNFPVLKTVTIPEGVESIGNYAFSSCSALTTVGMPLSLRGIGNYAFSQCAKLKSVTIPGSVNAIGNGAFSGSGLKQINIPGSVQTIGDNAFSDCDQMTNVVLEAGVKEIKSYAFYGCDKLTSVTMNKGLKKVSFEAFSLSPIQKLLFPDTVTTLDRCAFNRYDPSVGATDIYGDFHEHTKPDEVITASLREVHWPAGVPVIPKTQFIGFAKLKKVTLSNGVNKIESQAFSDCTGLKEVVVRSTKLLDIEGSAFPSTVITNATFTVPNCKGMSKVMKYLKGLKYKVSVTKHAAVVVDPAVKATYTKTGLTEGKHCKECGEVLVKQKVVPKLVRKPESVKLDKKGTVTLTMGNKLTLKATVTPKDAKTTLTWSSSNKKIATVNKSGVVTPVAKGTATITVKTGNNKSASVKVKVIGPKPKSVTIKQGKKATMKVGEKLTLKAVLSPAKAETKLTWSTSNKKVLTVSDKGVVTAVKTGTATVTVKTGNGKTASIVIRVQKTRT